MQPQTRQTQLFHKSQHKLIIIPACWNGPCAAAWPCRVRKGAGEFIHQGVPEGGSDGWQSSRRAGAGGQSCSSLRAQEETETASSFRLQPWLWWSPTEHGSTDMEGSSEGLTRVCEFGFSAWAARL